MVRNVRWIGVAGLMVAVVLCSGCTMRGGGWLPSVLGGGKATFAFSGQLSEDGVSGQGDYHDHSASLGSGVDAHLVAEVNDDVAACLEENSDYVDFLLSVLLPECADFFGVIPTPDNTFLTFGSYTAQPARLGSGCFILVTVDQGQPNNGNGDFVFLAFIDGPYGIGYFDGIGYFNCGLLQGGNITVSPTP